MGFGHMISQRWAQSFSYLLNSKHHPDNVYLTCNNCNSELGDNFPDAQLRGEIEKRGTIGDWLELAFIPRLKYVGFLARCR